MRLRRQHFVTTNVEGSEIAIPIEMAKEICNKHNSGSGVEKWDEDYWWFYES